ncbi:D-amino acid aminotransferase [Thalassotalea sp. HSM 43]|nr:D-amino acid aminotransferase [Thalassotalea sp. HSM 43]
MDTVYLNGEWLAKQQAKISIFDRGFLFADGIYEVIPVYHGNPFRLNEHLNRLQYCLEQIQLTSPYSSEQWQTIIEQLIERNGGGHMSIYLQVTRGVHDERDHLYKENITPTVLLMASPLTVAEQPLTSCKATLLADTRWQHCDIKSIALLGNIMLRNQAQAKGYDEAILHRDGKITEGTTSNVFIVKDGTVYTPPQNNDILGGITRDVIIELCHTAGVEIQQQCIHIEQLLAADEVWISSSSREISPVIQIDDKIIGHGKVGPISKTLFAEFQHFKRQLLATKSK